MSYRKYYAQDYAYTTFLVPREYDIHDTSIVKNYDMRYSTLTLTLVDGKEVEIEGDLQPMYYDRTPLNEWWIEIKDE